MLGRIRPIPAELGPGSTNASISQIWPGFAQAWTEVGECWTHFDQSWSEIGRLRPRIEQSCPEYSTRSGTMSAKVGSFEEDER